MDRMRGQLFSGPAFAADQNRRVRRRNFGDELIDGAHRSAFANHLVFDSDLFVQAAIFIFQRLNLPRVLESNRRNSGDARQQLQMLFVKACRCVACVEIDHAQGLLENQERN